MYLERNAIISTLNRCVVVVDCWCGSGIAPDRMRCTLSPDYVPPQTDLEEHIPDEQIILVWDVDNRWWRRLDVNKILRFTPEV
jgi:hypothetical protein